MLLERCGVGVDAQELMGKGRGWYRLRWHREHAHFLLYSYSYEIVMNSVCSGRCEWSSRLQERLLDRLPETASVRI